MAKKPTDTTAVTPDLTVRISRFLTNIMNTPSCHNFHAEAAALREIVGFVPAEQPPAQEHRSSTSGTPNT